MLISEKEVKRIVSIHFKEKYNLDVDPEKMEWDIIESIETDIEMLGLEIDDRGALSYLDQGGVDEEDDSDSDSD